MSAPVLETDRLILRRFVADDLPAYQDLFSQPAVIEFLPPLRTPNEAWRNMAMMEGGWTLRGYSMAAMVERASGRVIGRAGPWHPEGHPGLEIGWATHPDVQGKGYATEAAIAWRNWLFARMPDLTEILHVIAPTNHASKAVALKLGARATGKMYDHPINGPLEIFATPRDFSASA